MVCRTIVRPDGAAVPELKGPADVSTVLRNPDVAKTSFASDAVSRSRQFRGSTCSLERYGKTDTDS